MLAVSTRSHRAALPHARQIEIAFVARAGPRGCDQHEGVDRRRPDRAGRACVGVGGGPGAKPENGGERIGLIGGRLIIEPPPHPFPGEGMTTASVEPFIGRRVAPVGATPTGGHDVSRSEEKPSELQSLMRISYAVFCLK